MAKKKQFAGKKTKLAKLPLTRVLAGHEEGQASPPASGPPSSRPQPAYLGREAAEGAAGPLAATYLYLMQELTSLRSQLLPPAHLPVLTPQPSLPRNFSDRRRLAQALFQAREGLLELHRLLFPA